MQKTPVFRILQCAAILTTASMMLSCEDDDPTGPAAVNPADLIGNWKVVSYTESWDMTEEGQRDQGTDIDTSVDELVIIDAQRIRSWENYGGTCYDTSSSEYSISGNQIVGSDFSGSESEGGATYSYSTSAAIQGDQLVITSNESGSGPDISGWYRVVVVHTRYSGPVPPESWPHQACAGSTFKKRVSRILE